MPLTLPSSISALRGVSSTRAPIWLVEVRFPSPAGTKYYSFSEQVTWSGHTFERNRGLSIPSFDSGLIDRKTKNFSSLEIEFDNLADNGSSSFPFTALEAGQNLEDAFVLVYCYSPDAADAVTMWSGWTRGRSFDGREKKFVLSASFFFESFDLSIPNTTIQQKGFSLNESSAKTDDDNDQDPLYIPSIYGVADFKIKPTIYNHWIEGQAFKIEFILSSTHNGFPFNAGDVTAAQFKLRGSTQASVVEFYPGNQVAAPGNLTRFPENQIHPLVAFGYAEFAITDQNKATVDDPGVNDVKARIGNGKVLLDTGLPSENPVLILRDILRDPIYGLGLPSTAFDNTIITNAANYVGTRYAVIYELAQPIAVIDLVQRILGDCHCYMTFENGLIQINAKKTSETSAATFATIDSGIAGRKIDADYVDVEIKDSSELTNQVTRQYRSKKHGRRIVTLYDPTAQAHAGGTIKKVVEEKIDAWETHGIYDDTQAQINSAIILRENLNANLYGSFQSPIWDCLDIVPGDVVTVRTVDIFNNGANKDVRIIKKSIDTISFVITFSYQIYLPAVYNDNAVGLGTDLLRGGEDVAIPGRPPDLTPISLTITDVNTNDTDGKSANVRALFTVPAYDASVDAADGIFHEPPIASAEVWWNWADESVENARLGGALAIRQQATQFNATIDFQTDFRKSKSIIVYFVSIAPNAAKSRIGWIPDPAKVSYLTANLSANGATASVASSSLFTVGDTILIEREILTLASKATGSLTFTNTAGVRTPFYNTLSIAHPGSSTGGTEIAFAKLSYPALVLSYSAPRYTYPVVTGLTAIGQGDRVDLKWADISAENRESYLVYWSTVATALTDPALLGSATPAWYLANPLAPPAGVNLSVNDDLKHKVLQSEIGGANVVVRSRIAAKNGKNNYSTSLSASASASSSGSTVPDSAAPNNGTPLTIKKAKLKSGGKLIVRPLIPTVQMNTWFKNVLVIHDNNSTGGGRKFYDPAESAWVTTYADGTTEIDLGLGTVEGHPIKKSEIFVGRTQFFVRFGVWNMFNGGTPTYSLDTGNPITQAGAEGDGLSEDPAAPVLASPSTPDLQERFGDFGVSCPTPTANIITLDEFQVVMSTQNTAPAGNPTVGLEGVVKIKKGQFVQFNRRTDVAATLFFYYRAHNAFNGGSYSVWSTGASVLGTAISRPGEDIIGTEIPSLPFGLQRGATGQSSPPNSGNTYFLDIGATSDPTLYIGMTIHIPTLAATNRVRQITLYDPVFKKVTVSPAWTAVPASSLAFEIHRGTVNNSRSNQSGSGHTTTTFVLDTNASNVDGFYNGWTIWIPGGVAADVNRQVSGYVGATRTCTVDVAFSVAPANQIAYFITQGNIAYTSSAASTIANAAPIRTWLDTQASNQYDQLEIILTQGDNAYSLTHFQIQVATGGGQVKHDEVIPLTSAPTYTFQAVNAGRAARVRFRNLYRGNLAVPSDGWSSWSDWVAVPRSTATTQAYSPDIFIPVIVDYEDRLPIGHYTGYMTFDYSMSLTDDSRFRV